MAIPPFELYRQANGNLLSTDWGGEAPIQGGDAPTLTVTAISQDQIDGTWEAIAGTGIEIQRSEGIAGPFNTVAVYPEYEEKISLYSHQPDTSYYFRGRYVSSVGVGAWSDVSSASTLATTGELHVAKTGNDETGDGSLASPYLTIQKAVHNAVAGNIIQVHEGTYEEFATSTGGNPMSEFEVRMGIAFVNSGTPTAPIIVQPFPGDEVVVDQGGDKGSFYWADVYHPWPDYIHVKGFKIRNCLTSAIASYNSAGDYSDNDSMVARGVVLEGLDIANTQYNQVGINSGAIRMHSHRDWVIRNNKIEATYHQDLTTVDLNGSNCIYSYSGFGALIEFNEFIPSPHTDGSHAIFLKDIADNPPAYPVRQSTIRYNYIEGMHRALYLSAGIDQAMTDSWGFNYMHNNIMHDCNSPYGTSGSKQSARILYENNFINYLQRTAMGFAISRSGLDPETNPESHYVTVDKIVEGVGNIFSNTNGGTNYTLNDVWNETEVRTLNYNIYESGPDVSIRYGARITSLNSWRATNDPIISVVTPDENSVEAIPIGTVATDANNKDYSIPSGSVALGFLPSGNNAGPYKYGREIIGRVA